MLAPDLGLPGPELLSNSFLLFVRHPIYGVLLQQPELTETAPDRSRIRNLENVLNAIADP